MKAEVWYATSLDQERNKSEQVEYILGSSTATAGINQFEEQQNRQQARGNKPSAKLKVENQKGETKIYLSSFVVAEWLACWTGVRLQRSAGKRWRQLKGYRWWTLTWRYWASRRSGNDANRYIPQRTLSKRKKGGEVGIPEAFMQVPT